MFPERTSVGLDVHARSVAAAAIDGLTGEVFMARLTPSAAEVLGSIGRLPGPCAVVYESGPTGFGLARALIAAGLRCEVAASSKLQLPAGDRVKTDARDALHLARLLRLDEIVPVRIPGPAEEAARDQALDDCRRTGAGKRGFPDQPIWFKVERAWAGHTRIRVTGGASINRTAVAPDDQMYKTVARAGVEFFADLNRLCPSSDIGDEERATLESWLASRRD